MQKFEFSDFADVKKAFDTIGNSIFLFALSQYGFTEKKQLFTKIRSKQLDTVSKKFGWKLSVGGYPFWTLKDQFSVNCVLN